MNIIDNSIESIGTGNKRVRIIGVNKFENLNGESNKDGTEIHCRWYGCRGFTAERKETKDFDF